MEPTNTKKTKPVIPERPENYDKLPRNVQRYIDMLLSKFESLHAYAEDLEGFQPSSHNHYEMNAPETRAVRFRVDGSHKGYESITISLKRDGPHLRPYLQIMGDGPLAILPRSSNLCFIEHG